MLRSNNCTLVASFQYLVDNLFVSSRSFSSPKRRPPNLVSRLFQPQNLIPKDAEVKYDDVTSKSQKLMLDLGIIRQASTGSFYLLPLGERSLQKLIDIVDEGMQDIGAQKVLLPLLTSADLWKTTGRWDSAGAELFKLRDRHDKQFVLSPTHEEAVTELVSSVAQLSHRQLPLRLYQITSKFRDEMKPRSGLLRGKEFVMKDLYTFDSSVENATETYDAVNEAYDRIFQKIGVKYVKVLGDSGMMGGSLSHEYHFPAEVGEDRILVCQGCDYRANREICGGEECPVCLGRSHMIKSLAIEVGHTFFLGTKYSAPLRATFLGANGKPDLVQMGSYGLGMTRILAASVECLSTAQEVRWPLALAPYSVCIVPPKDGSNASSSAHLSRTLYDTLNACERFTNDVIIDDRCRLTIGKRLLAARRVGYPFVVVIGKRSLEDVPLFEVHTLATDERTELNQTGVVDYLKQAAAA